jgi:methyltransferase family protein
LRAARRKTKAKLMERTDAEAAIKGLYKHFLRREPGSDELGQWIEVALAGIPISQIIEKFGGSKEYKQNNRVVPFFSPGHYYSPIVDPDDKVRTYMLAQRQRVGASPAGIDMRIDRMREFFTTNVEFMASASFERDANPKHRYYYDNGGYPLGDALTLRAMINFLRPRGIVEIGSGFSTACMLDTLDEIALPARITCIEPYPERLRGLLRGHDQVEILECPVQDVPVARFSELDAGDILFIDSTHVLKSGSDVHYELFEIIPTLKRGVMIHFHDLMYPFEYPLGWIFDTNYSWNEAYAVRAFLMYNECFVPFYSSSLVLQLERPLVARLFPAFPENPGTNLWIRREK